MMNILPFADLAASIETASNNYTKLCAHSEQLYSEFANYCIKVQQMNSSLLVKSCHSMPEQFTATNVNVPQPWSLEANFGKQFLQDIAIKYQQECLKENISDLFNTWNIFNKCKWYQ